MTTTVPGSSPPAQGKAGGSSPELATGAHFLAIGARFSVEVNGSIQAYFNECSGLGATVKQETFEEGGSNQTTLKFPARADYANVTLKRGMTEWTDLYKWFTRVLEGKRDRQSVTITLLDGTSEPEPIRSWQLLNAFPVKWTGPSMKADATSVAIETLEFAHEGLIGAE